MGRMSDPASPSGPVFKQLTLVVSDMDAALAFWRRLGLVPDITPGGIHASADLAPGLIIEWDTAGFAARWDSGSPGASAGGIIVGFAVASREAVDDLYAELTAAGYRGHQRPYDTFWGARYAIVDDPDGNAAGIMSPVEDDRKSWPPAPAPGQ
jgi:catechol 2,3-dioxygenase-like lactoylglutathione lyase family enzyme